MAVLDSAAEDFRMGRVVSRLFNALFSNAITFLALAALLSIPMLLLSLYTITNLAGLGINPAGGVAPGRGVNFFWLIALQTTVYLVFSYLLQAAIVQGTITYLNDEKASFGQCMSIALKSIGPLVVIAFLSALGMVIGGILLLVPGVIVALMWMVVVPVRIVENTGITESFARSRALTKGHRGKIFLLVLIYLVLALALAFATRPILGVSMFVARPGELNIAYIAVDWVERVVLAALTAAGVASIYFELRLIKEGIGAQQMAAAFD